MAGEIGGNVVWSIPLSFLNSAIWLRNTLRHRTSCLDAANTQLYIFGNCQSSHCLGNVQQPIAETKLIKPRYSTANQQHQTAYRLSRP